MGDIYVILLKNDVLDGKTYRSFDEAKQALIKTALEKEWRLENNRDETPIVGFKNKFGIVDNDETNEVEFPKEGGNGLTELDATGDDIGKHQPVNIRKLTLNANGSPPPADVEAVEAVEAVEDKKERKKRAPMSDEAKAAMKAKREATIAAKKAAPVPAEPAAAPAEAAPASDGEDKDKKARKPRGPMSEEAKAAMKAKREATIAAKKAAV